MSAFLQNDPSLSPKDRLIFALDYPTLEEAKRAIVALKDHVGLFKVGLELFVGTGPGIFKVIAENSGCGIFLDLKFHDIPETVQAAVKAAALYPVRFITVHASDGRELLRSAITGARMGPKVLAVTVLTGTSNDDLWDSGVDKSLKCDDLALLRAKISKEVGCHGVVCSGLEVRAIKEQLGQQLIAVVPGIRPEWAVLSQDDQKRIVTPRQAIRDGADYLVVGRPIRSAKDPAQAADRIVDEIKVALQGR